MKIWHCILVALLVAAGCGSKGTRISVDGIKQGKLVLDDESIVISELGATLLNHGFSAETTIIPRDLALKTTEGSTNTMVILKIKKDTPRADVKGAMESLTQSGYWRISFVDIKEKDH